LRGERRLKPAKFKILGRTGEVEVIAAGRGIRDLDYLQRAYGRGRWRKLKGVATVELPSGRIRLAEIHWYEAHGIGRVDHKIKRYLD
jgi:hypothetical protein